MSLYVFQNLDNEDYYLALKIFPPKSNTAQLKQIDPITLLSNLLQYLLVQLLM